MGAAGRYDRVPVFEESALARVDAGEATTFDGLAYSFVKMDAVD